MIDLASRDVLLGDPVRGLETYLEQVGYEVVRTLSFAGLSTVTLVRTKDDPRPRVVKVLFGYSTLARLIPERKHALYGYQLFRVVDDATFEYWRNQFALEHYLLTRLDGVGWVRALTPLQKGSLDSFEMEYAEGGSLAQRLSNGPLDRDATHAALKRVADLFFAVGQLHALGYVHRDLTPMNILASLRGILCADLNSARHLASPGDRAGRFEPLLYWAPELERDYANARPQADTFALASIAFRWLTGTLPRYSGPPLEELNAFVEPRCARLLQQCLAYDWARRPTSASQCSQEIRAWVGVSSDLVTPAIG